MNKKNQKDKGFTLIELLVVISIIALLSSVILAGVQAAREKSQISKVRSEMAEFVKALEIYKTAYGHYPSSVNCSHGGIEECYFSSDKRYPGAETLSDEFNANILDELKSKKIYSGNLEDILKSTPKSVGYYLFYTSTPAGMMHALEPYDPPPYCNDKPSLTGSNEYYLIFRIWDDKLTSNQITGLESTYIGKSSDDLGYCSPN